MNPALTSLFVARFYQTEELMKQADSIMRSGRKRHTISGAFLVPESRAWGSGNLLNEATITNLLLGFEPDAENAIDALERIQAIPRKGDIVVPPGVAIDDLIPVSSPILDYLAVDAERIDAYRYPPMEEIKIFQQNRGVDSNSLYLQDSMERIPIREVIIGRSSAEDIEDAIKFYKECFDAEQQIFPCGTTATCLKTVEVSSYDLERLAKNPGVPRVVKPPKPGFQTQAYPLKWFIGNPLRYLLVISWPVETDVLGSIMIMPFKLQAEMIKLIDAIRVPIGIGMHEVMACIKNSFKLFGWTDKCPGPSCEGPKCTGDLCIDLRPLAALAGWNMQSNDLTALMLTLSGGFVNVSLAANNRSWARLWPDLPDSFKLAAIAELKACHMVAVILMAVLLRDVFPDPDALPAFFTVVPLNPQVACARSFCQWLTYSIKDTRVVMAKARGRKELLSGIQDIYKSGYWSSEGMALWSDLFGNWNTITFGGPRRLHTVREMAVRVVGKIKDSKLPCVYLETELETDSAAAYARFGRTDCYFVDDPPVVCGSPGLWPHPETVSSLLEVDMAEFKASDLIRHGKKTMKSGRFGFYEFLRLNPTIIPEAMLRFEKTGDIKEEFWLQHDSLYEDVRIMHFRVFDSQPQPVIWIEERIQSRIVRLKEEENRLVREAEEKLIKAHARNLLIEEVVEYGPYARRVGVLNRIKPGTKEKVSRPQPREKTTHVPFTEMSTRRKQELEKFSEGVKRVRAVGVNDVARLLNPRESMPASVLSKEGVTGRSVPSASVVITEEHEVTMSDMDRSTEELPAAKHYLAQKVALKGLKRARLSSAVVSAPVVRTTASGMTIRIPRKASRVKAVPEEIDLTVEDLDDDPEKHTWPELG